MLLNTEILFHALQNTYSVFAPAPFKNPCICSPLVYDGVTLLNHHVYIIRPEQLAFLDVTDIESAFLVTGMDADQEIHLSADVILIRENAGELQLLNLLMGIFDYYNHWESMLNDCSLDYTGIQKMLDCSRELLDGSLVLADFYFNQVAYTSDFAKYNQFMDPGYSGKTSDPMVDELLSDPRFYQLQKEQDIFYYPDEAASEACMCCNLFRDGEQNYYARLMLLCDGGHYTHIQEYLLNFLAQKVHRVFSQISPFSLPLSAYSSLRETIRNLLTKKLNIESLVYPPLARIHWSPDDTYLLVKLISGFRRDHSSIHEMVCNQLEIQFPESCCLLYDDSAVLVINISKNEPFQEDDFRSKLSVFLRENLYKAGISNFFNHFSEIKNAYYEASVALEIGNSRNSTFWYFYFRDYAIDYIIAQSTSVLPEKSLIHPGIQILQKYDDEHNSEYLRTLKVLLECKYNITHAAEVLYIHRTTFLKRMDKIQRLTGVDLDDWRTRLHLMISFQMLAK